MDDKRVTEFLEFIELSFGSEMRSNAECQLAETVEAGAGPASQADIETLFQKVLATIYRNDIIAAGAPFSSQ